jgi:hypothetical protein
LRKGARPPAFVAERQASFSSDSAESDDPADRGAAFRKTIEEMDVRLKCLSASASIRRQIQMALLVRIRGNNSR